jgi:hypothetical protein
MWLRQSTASQEIKLGPFLDDTDGKTAETALSIANTDIKIWKHGATSEANKNSGGATHIAAGRYYIVLDATDTDTLGLIEIDVHVAGALPVKYRAMVLTAHVFDSLLMGSDKLQVHTDELTADLITNTVLATSAVNEIRDAVLDRGLAGNHDTAGTVGKFLQNMDLAASTLGSYLDTEIAAILAAVDTEVGAIKAKTDLIPAAPAAVGDLPTVNAIADALLDRANAIEAGWTVRMILRIIAAAVAGKASGLETTNPVYRDILDTKDRIDATVDADGNRSAIILDGT